MSRRGMKVLFVLITSIFFIGGFAVLFSLGILRINLPSEKEFPVQGVDVSSYQGEIDWAALAEQGMDFAFIKATEGSSWQDPYFEANWKGAGQAGLTRGAYHFFSFDSSGLTQADNFIAAVPITAGALPPTVDIELYGDYINHPPDRERVCLLLDELLSALEAQYGRKPILYATMASYKRYLQGGYDEYPLWIREVTRRPALPEGRKWAFWQFSDKGRLSGFHGREPYIDLNVFSGTAEDFSKFAEP